MVADKAANARVGAGGAWHRPRAFFNLAKRGRLTVALLKKQEQAQTSATRVAIDLVAELFHLTASMSFVISPLCTRL